MAESKYWACMDWLAAWSFSFSDLAVVPLDCRAREGIALQIIRRPFDCARGLGEGGRNAQGRQHSDHYHHHRMLLHVWPPNDCRLLDFQLTILSKSQRKQVEQAIE